MTMRTETYRQLVLNAPFNIDIERAKYYTESYKATEGLGLHPATRSAKALERTLDNMIIFIMNEEQLVGHRTSKLLGVILPVERGDVNCMLPVNLKVLKKRINKPFQITEEEEQLLNEKIWPFWKGKTVLEKRIALYNRLGLLKEIYSKEQLNNMDLFSKFMLGTMPFAGSTVLDDQGHLVMGHAHLMRSGITGIKRHALRKLEEVNQYSNSSATAAKVSTIQELIDSESKIDYYVVQKRFQERFKKTEGYSADKKAFLEAVIICCDAFTRFIKRYSELARIKAKSESETKRAAELITIAESCNWISENPPRTFREALQLTWFNELVGNISHGLGAILSIGRPDQYLYPYYKSDLASKILTSTEAKELLEEFMMKLCSNLLLMPIASRGSADELSADHVAVTVGGVDTNGNDAVNELSYLFLDAFADAKASLSFSVRVAPNINSRAWLRRAVDIYLKTCGTAFYNDDIIITSLQKAGVTLEDARDYSIVGCIEPTTNGNAFPITAGNGLGLTQMLQEVLKGDTGGYPNEFKSFGQLRDAFAKYIKNKVAKVVQLSNIKDIIHGENYPNPFISMSIDGCIENALDMTQGGAKYNFNTLSSSGFATTVNSLCALKKVVFEDQQLSMPEMLTILNNNFKDNEILRNKIINKVPKFGNDDDYVDCIAKDVLNIYSDEINSHSCIRMPGTYRPSIFSAGTHVSVGSALPATPDGRKAGQPISNSISPSNNTEHNGPTAVLNSISKLENTKIGSGISLNMRLLPSLIDTEHKRELLTDMLLSHFKMGGMHVQFNIISQQDLIDAQDHPENYQDLIVRVSGYCTYFVNLPKALQNDIIDRYQFESY